MISEHIATQIYNNFAFPPTVEQKNVINSISTYISDGDKGDIFILNGYAGTGKTTIIGALVAALNSLEIKSILLAPTGRAAKVMSSYSKKSAYTIHKIIYRQRERGATGGSFSINFKSPSDTIYIVDEASMLSNFEGEVSGFGTGRLIDDLIDYINNGDNNRLIIVGDNAQLPPVGLDFSPALDPMQMNRYGNVTYSTMSEVVRLGQGSGSSILKNATAIRSDIENGVVKLPKITLSKRVHSITGAEMLEELDNAYREVGAEDTIVICRSNKRATEFNNGIRNSVLDIEEELACGDMLMIVKNNYHYTKKDPDCNLDFIANGDIGIVERVYRHRNMYGFRYAEVELRLPDYDDYTFECMILLDSLRSNAPSLSRAELEKLFYAIEGDYAEIGNKRTRYSNILKNEYWNALQVKFAYAVTCHKAQGGQWRRVFIDRMIFGDEPMSRDFQRWLYTAVTRSTGHLFFINWQAELFSNDG